MTGNFLWTEMADKAGSSFLLWPRDPMIRLNNFYEFSKYQSEKFSSQVSMSTYNSKKIWKIMFMHIMKFIYSTKSRNDNFDDFWYPVGFITLSYNSIGTWSVSQALPIFCPYFVKSLSLVKFIVFILSLQALNIATIR